MSKKSDIEKISNRLPAVSMEKMELALILTHLRCSDWNRTKAALSLGVSLKTVQNKIKKLNSFDVETKESSNEQSEN